MQIRAHLFGKFQLEAISSSGVSAAVPLEPGKVRDLLCFLLLYPERAHHREALSSQFWGEGSTERSLKYLRQALWQQQTILAELSDSDCPVLLVDGDWVQLNPNAKIWVDTTVFETACLQIQNRSGSELSLEEANLVRQAVHLYRGDVLEGCHQDWCLMVRERLQNLYLGTLDKLMDYCEVHCEVETGLSFGAQILALDRARECTYQRLMRLYYQAGDRSSAVRQFSRCSEALQTELGIAPSKKTRRILEMIQTDQADPDSAVPEQPRVPTQLLGDLERLQQLIWEIRGQVETVLKISPGQ